MVFDADYAYWMSDKYDGLVKLSVDANEITLRTTNVNGQLTEHSVTVVVNDDVGYPGPMLAVDPDQLDGKCRKIQPTHS